jgi:hypothetical protein
MSYPRNAWILYEKLKPFLRVQYLGRRPPGGRLEKWIHVDHECLMWAESNDAELIWHPKPKQAWVVDYCTGRGQNVALPHPTYEEFCRWYGLDEGYLRGDYVTRSER